MTTPRCLPSPALFEALRANVKCQNINDRHLTTELGDPTLPLVGNTRVVAGGARAAPSQRDGD